MVGWILVLENIAVYKERCHNFSVLKSDVKCHSIHCIFMLCVCVRQSEGDRKKRPTLWTDSMYIVVTATFFQLSAAAGPRYRKRHTGCWDGIHKGSLTGAWQTTHTHAQTQSDCFIMAMKRPSHFKLKKRSNEECIQLHKLKKKAKGLKGSCLTHLSKFFERLQKSVKAAEGQVLLACNRTL